MRAVGAIILAVWSTWLFSQPAFAEKRVALVIGNSAYQNVTRLANPANDSGSMSETLKSAGFDVVELKRDLKVNEMRRALRDFSDRVRDADMAIVYFAGHGIEIDGTNYLIPVDAVLERDIDAFDEAIPLDRILTVIEPAKQLRLVILDACRDNPFGRTMKRTIASRTIGRGLAKVDPTSPNTLIAFAAKAGSTASDGDSKNSPFTAALVKHLPKPGLDLRKAFGFTRDDVLKATNNKQEPFIYGSLGGDDVALVPAVTVPPSATSPVDANAAIRRDYEFALQVSTKAVWDSFIRNNPSGFYTDLAKAQRDKLGAESASAAATEKARAAAEEQKRLAIEGARAIEQARAATLAREAEEARVAAERKKLLEEAKVAAAERAKAAAQAKAAEDARLAAEKAGKIEQARVAAERTAAERKEALEEARAAEAERAKAAAQAKAEEDARLAAAKKKVMEEAKAAEAERAKAEVQTKVANENKDPDNKPIGQVATLTPPDQAGEAIPKSDKSSATDIPRLLQVELRRVGCNTGAIDGNWNAAAQKSLGLFNKNAGTKLDAKVASVDALDVVRGKTGRICPLICDHGYKADGDNCTKITCRAGYEVGDDNTCERIEVKQRKMPVAKLTPSGARDAIEPRDQNRSLTPQGMHSSHHKLLPGEPPNGTIQLGARVVVQSSACRTGQMLELIGGSNTHNIPRKKRCIAAN
ncbi:MAG TPA: caspase family protein [Pseudolabrys sp.]|nr:caspase family protein [Pseudolabrys sp.]